MKKGRIIASELREAIADLEKLKNTAPAMPKRSDYGMTNWESLVGDDIELRIEAELFRSDTESPAGKPVEPAEPPASSSD